MTPTTTLVHYFPLQAHCFAFGGFDLQMLSALRAVNDLQSGIVVEPINPWSRNDNFQIAHFWGLDISHFNQIKWAKRAGKRVVLTGLLSYYETFQERFRHHASSIVGMVRILKNILAEIDAFVVVSEEQKQIAISKFNCDPSKIFVIPNMVENPFWEVEKSPIVGDYLLSVGNICPRKNQVKLAKACIEANVKLILVGDILAGEEDYAKELTRLESENNLIKWMKGLSPASKELVDLEKNCLGFALLSNQETQPISLLEAAVLQKPLIVSNRPFAKQSYYSPACLVDDLNIDSIVSGIKKLQSDPNQHIPNLSNLEPCRPQNVALAYNNLYNQLFVG